MLSRYRNGNVPVYEDPFANPEAVEALRERMSKPPPKPKEKLPLPAWMRDSNLLPKKPPTRSNGK